MAVLVCSQPCRNDAVPMPGLQAECWPTCADAAAINAAVAAQASAGEGEDGGLTDGEEIG